jgi:hypothetical protein
LTFMVSSLDRANNERAFVATSGCASPRSPFDGAANPTASAG